METAPRFQLFRRSEARPCDLMTYDAGTSDGGASGSLEDPESDAHALDQGHDLKVLFDTPGMSLVRAWFKSEFPLPRHTHDVDCVYFIVGGSLRMGEDVLRAGDGFFVGANVPYTYTPGPDGLEILEFRASNSFDIRVMGDAAKLGEKSLAKIVSRQEAWSTELAPPSA
jgi:mannose-6-phosphate isomerase-like protein (cupin superfamily)